MKKRCGLIACTLLFITIQGFAQVHSSPPAPPSHSPTADTLKKAIAHDTAKHEDSTDDDDIRSYALGLNYGTNQTYHGVQSTSKLPYIEPNFTYTAPSGFYTELLDQDYLLAKHQRYNAFAIDPGWNIDLADNTSWNINLTHYFITLHPPPSAISSDISNCAETYISQYVGETEGKLTIDYDYYKETAIIKTPNDIVFTPDISHTFKIKLSKKTSISLIPEGNIDLGTRNLYSHFAATSGIDTLLNTLNSKQLKQLPVAEQLQLKKAEVGLHNTSFGTMDYNLILSIDIAIGHFEFEPVITHMSPLYKPVGQPNTPLTYGALSLTYTIEHKCKKY